MSDNHHRTNPDTVAAKKKTPSTMNDTTFQELCAQVPDIEARYKRIVDAYYEQKKLLGAGMKPAFAVSWKTMVTKELPLELSVQEWLSLVTNYKIKVRMAPKKVPAKPKQVPTLFGPKPPTGQLKIF